jgi:hypothetical protein
LLNDVPGEKSEAFGQRLFAVLSKESARAYNFILGIVCGVHRCLLIAGFKQRLRDDAEVRRHLREGCADLFG